MSLGNVGSIVSQMSLGGVTSSEQKAAPSPTSSPRSSLVGVAQSSIAATQTSETKSSAPTGETRTSFTKQEGGKLLLTVPLAKGEMAVFESKPAKVGKIPAGAADKVEAWLTNNQKALSENKGRIPYDKKSIPQALDKFQNEYHCSWHVMKEKCTSNETMQIINDMRSAYLEEMFVVVKKEFHGSLQKIEDFGSTKLTSDRDLAFRVGEGNQTKEAEIVSRFNHLFEATWDMPSATVFDTNAYTMQYILTASDPKIEQKRSSLQGEGSLLMRIRNSPKESWETLKAGTLSQIPDKGLREAKAAEFAKVEKQNAELDHLFNLEVIRQGTTSEGPSTALKHLTKKMAAGAAEAILEGNPQVGIEAKATLHETFKTSYKTIEQQRLRLFATLKNLDRAVANNNPEEFAVAFNSRITHLTQHLSELAEAEKNQLTKQEILGQIKQLKSATIASEDAPEMMAAFRDRSSLDNKEKGLQQELIGLEVQLNRYSKLKLNLDRLQEKFSNGGAAPELGKIDGEMKKVQHQIGEIEHRFGVKTEKELAATIDQQSEGIKKQLKTLQSDRKALDNEHGELFDLSNALNRQGDLMLVHMQRLNMLGMCFAQEAHISEGAFAVIVLGLQGGSDNIITPNQYMQAFREVQGFYAGHQAHGTPHEKMVEASKYGDRLMTIQTQIQQRAKILGITLPKMDAESTKLASFFTEISAARGSGKTAAQKQDAATAAAFKSGLLAKGETFDQKVADEINGRLDQMATTLEAWITMLPEKQGNAYYRTA